MVFAQEPAIACDAADCSRVLNSGARYAEALWMADSFSRIATATALGGGYRRVSGWADDHLGILYSSRSPRCVRPLRRIGRRLFRDAIPREFLACIQCGRSANPL